MQTWSRVALLFGVALASSFAHGAGVVQPTERASQRYNLGNDSLGIGGYDPVAYFPEGGGAPRKGSESLSVTHRGVTYRFATQEHLDTFKANPGRYEPAHGGWCTYAMAKDGSRVEVDPQSFVVADNRLFLFYKDLFNDTRKKFLKEQVELTKSADERWKEYSGESPRLGGSPLSERLEAMRRRFEDSAPAATRETYEQGIRDVAASGVLERALKVGARAPDFTLADATGKEVRLSELLGRGPVVLTWYRGGWCPYCNIQLRAYQESLAEIKGLGATLVALSPELPDNSLSTAEREKLEFTVLSDVGNKVARDYGVVYRLPEEVVNAFRGRLDIPGRNGDQSWELPLAATYVVSREGKVVYAFVDADYRRRAEPSEILGALRTLSEASNTPR